ncbi:MAG: M23 family metallopeptidase [Oscillospiraceae bacterium]|nr:M23 family metallopeptidase [Oscillospiraceae bacterium]
MDSYESTDARFSEIRAAREQRAAQREADAGRKSARKKEPAGRDGSAGRDSSTRWDRAYDDAPPYENFEDVEGAPKGSLVRVVATQAVVCALLLGALFGAQKVMPNTWRQLRRAYTQAMETDMSAAEVWAAARAAFASLKEDIYVLAPYKEETTENPTEPPAQRAAAEAPAQAQGDVFEMPPGAGGIDVALEYANQSCSIAPIESTARPYRPVREGELSSAFGYRIHPISGEEGVHTGMDIAAQEGAPISAAFFGRVLQTGESKGYGKYVLMEHAGGLQTFYAHCSEIAAEEGMVLRPGDVIAYVGSTGNSTGPHVHFEVRLHGLRCDPAPLFGAEMYELKVDS